MTFEDTSRHIGLQGLAAGGEPLNSPAGTDLFGQAPVPASPSRWRGRERPEMIADISGLRGLGSSASVALTEFLASRSRERLGTDGSTEYSQTWRVKVTPAGRRYWAHTASGRRTSGSDCGGWATPTQRDHKDGASDLTNVPVNALLGRQVLGTALSSSPAPTGKRGALNPAFSLWLQGYPSHWMALAPSRESVRSGQRGIR